MRINIHSQNISLTDAIQAHLERRLNVAMRRFDTRISVVEVYIRDTDGAGKGVNDKSVLIKSHLPGLPAIVVEHVSSDLYTSISVASRRSKRALKRAMRRQQRIERRHSLQLEPDRLPGLAGARFNTLQPVDKP